MPKSAKEKGVVSQNGEVTRLVEDLLSGKAFSRIRGERLRLEQCRDKTTELLERFTNADRTVVREVLQEILSNGQRQELPLLEELVFEETPQHKHMPLLIAAMRARVPVWLYGDTGSGKTTAAAMVAKLLELPFRFISVCPSTTKSEFFGYRDAAGVYHSTAFREIFEGGGVFLIDEVDNGNPSILSVLNTALANDCCAFPDGNINRHEQAIFVAAANTIGRGADVQYIGRNALDATTLDRFIFIRMDIDENLENTLAGAGWDRDEVVDVSAGGTVKDGEWCRTVRRVRRACHELDIQHIVSPRAILYGRRLAAAGIGWKYLSDMCIWKGIRETDQQKILKFMEKNWND